MKPTFELCFTTEHPTRPGLWIQRRENFIGVLDVQQSDVDRDAKEGNWLNGEWGAEIKLVARDVVPLQRKKIQEHLDGLIIQHNKEHRKYCQAKKHMDEIMASGDGEHMSRWCDTENGRLRAEAALDCLQRLRVDLLGENLVLPVEDEYVD